MMRSAHGPAQLLALASVVMVLPFGQQADGCDLGAKSSKFEHACQVVDCITTKSPAIWALAHELRCETFQPLRTAPPDQRPRVMELVNSLLAFVRTSDDLWLVDRVAVALASCEDEIWTPLFLDLLDHPSPQIRWRAIQHFADVPSADARSTLEMLRETEARNWVRPDLLRSLARSGSTAALQDCIRFVDSEEHGLSAASVDCLRHARPPGALETVLRAARGPGYCLPRRALAALAAWPDSDEALDLLLEASRSNEMPSVAVDALASFLQPEATARLVEVAALADLDPNMQLSAIRALADRGHPGVATPPLPTRSVSFTTTIRLECIGSSYGSWVVEPPPERMSVRCWASPHTPGHFEDHERIPVGTAVHADDHFEAGDDHWVRLGYPDCWVPIEVLEPHIGPSESDEPSALTAEFDVSVSELGAPPLATLLSARLLSTFDLAGDITGVALDVDPSDRGAVVLLVELYEDAEGPLADHIWDVLNELSPVYRDDRELSKKISDALEE